MSGLDACVGKMEREGIAAEAIAVFSHYYEQLVQGETGVVPESELAPLDDVPSLEGLEAGDAPLDAAVVIKLNGGLGTSMGMTGPKLLLPVKGELTFLDVIARQILAMREAHGVRLPLVLMHSFATREPSLHALRRYDLEVDVPLDFVQSKEPKIQADTLEPVVWPPNPELEWCPPGHGDLYTSLQSSGVLERLLDEGYRYAFVSNGDNLGAVLDPRILAWFAASGAPFASEVIDRTEADRKGGHLAKRGDGLVLRESAQVADADQAAFQDVARHRFFNANNLWIDLDALATTLEDSGPVLGLPLIVNRKTVDPSDAASPGVIQLETAMGAAIGVFEGAQALHVPRGRFLPVKTTSDLLVLRSDAYVLGGDANVALAAGRSAAPLVSLSDEFKLVDRFEERFPGGPPSLVAADRLEVSGDVRFGRDVVVRGSARVEGPAEVPDGAVLGGA